MVDQMALSGWSERVMLAAGRGTTLGTLMDRLAAVHGDRRMVQEAGGGELTFRQSAERVGAMCSTVAGRVSAGDRVVLALPNTYDLWLASLAVSRAGAIPVPLNSELRPKEIELVAADAGAAWVVRSAEELLGSAGADPADPAPAGADP
ncbi:MAG: AMP-binding protein, partial [Acidimicrobiales bacterium]